MTSLPILLTTNSVSRPVRPMSTFIIAEAGVNHNGSVERALELVDVAAKAGADAVKFQTFQAEEVMSDSAPKANYQKETTDEKESQLDMVRMLQLDRDAHRAIANRCIERSIQFLSTPFDTQSATFLVEIFNVPKLKIPSGEITNGPLLLHIARLERPVILSTGMSTLSEIEQALSVLAFGYTKNAANPSSLDLQQVFASDDGQKALAGNVTILHCVTEYPAPMETVHLRAMDTIRHAFDLPVGLSDHTLGIAVPIAAVARGACLIEKHFTLDQSLPGPDHQASLEPEELWDMVQGIRDVETALGHPQKVPTGSEWDNRTIVRKSLVATESIGAGEVFTPDNLGAKRPGDGISPMEYWAKIGNSSNKKYTKNSKIK